MTTPERTPEAVLDFWLGSLRTAADASRENWQQGMLNWRLGPFARSTENRGFLEAQRAWCEQMHREGLDRFFGDPVWKTPKGRLAKLIVLDQFSRSVYRGTPLAFINDAVTAGMARQACENERDIAQYNVIERFWLYLPLAHAEDLTIQELGIEKYIRWSADLIAEVPRERRRINQFVAWSVVKASIEHSEALLVFGRFPHRNAIMRRSHRGGEPRYLADTMRPLWSFTQPPSPDYFALLGALCRLEDGVDESRVTREALARLLRGAGLAPDAPGSPMDVFDLAGGDTVSGDLRQHGFTEVLAELVGRYRDHPRHGSTIVVTDFLAWPVHIRMTSDEIAAFSAEHEPAARLVFLGPDGARLAREQRLKLPAHEPNEDEWTKGLTAMRTVMRNDIQARVVLGGRVEGYKGTMPGIAEETCLSLEAGQPVFVLGGFGGCARDIAETVGLVERWAGSRGDWAGRECFRKYSPDDLRNGLSREENVVLARTPHIQEAVTLVSRGLCRILGDGVADARSLHWRSPISGIPNYAESCLQLIDYRHIPSGSFGIA